MLAGSTESPGGHLTVAVPVVRSTGLHAASRLCASIGMAVAYARGDQNGDRYRDLLELCVGDYRVSVETAVAMARRLFPDVPVSAYNVDEIDVDDVVTLARLAVQRGARVLPVLLYDERFRAGGETTCPQTLVLSTFHPDDGTKRSFFDTEPPQVGAWRVGSRIADVPAGFQCLVFGWLPPSPTGS